MCSSLIARLLGMDTPPEHKLDRLGHSAASYRAARARKRMEEKARKEQGAGLLVPQPVLDGATLKKEYTEWLDQDRGGTKDGLLATTILEEEESPDALP